MLLSNSKETSASRRFASQQEHPQIRPVTKRMHSLYGSSLHSSSAPSALLLLLLPFYIFCLLRSHAWLQVMGPYGILSAFFLSSSSSSSHSPWLQVMGVPSNKDYLACVMADPRFAAGETTTSFLQDMEFSPHGVEVIDAGMNTTVQVSTLGPRSSVLTIGTTCRSAWLHFPRCCAPKRH